MRITLKKRIELFEQRIQELPEGFSKGDLLKQIGTTQQAQAFCDSLPVLYGTKKSTVYSKQACMPFFEAYIAQQKEILQQESKNNSKRNKANLPVIIKDKHLFFLSPLLADNSVKCLEAFKFFKSHAGLAEDTKLDLHEMIYKRLLMEMFEAHMQGLHVESSIDLINNIEGFFRWNGQ